MYTLNLYVEQQCNVYTELDLTINEYITSVSNLTQIRRYMLDLIPSLHKARTKNPRVKVCTRTRRSIWQYAYPSTRVQPRVKCSKLASISAATF